MYITDWSLDEMSQNDKFYLPTNLNFWVANIIFLMVKPDKS